MKRYWMADPHFGHGNIIEYEKRPFRDVEHMNSRLIAEANMRAKKGDTLVNVGDFLCRGVARGVEGLRHPWDFYADQFLATLILLEGNHDKNNRVKTAGRALIGRMSHFNFAAFHLPMDNEGNDPLFVDWVRKSCAFAIVGHVHSKWAERRHDDGFVEINVGLDVRNYRPVSDDEVVKIYLENRK